MVYRGVDPTPQLLVPRPLACRLTGETFQVPASLAVRAPRSAAAARLGGEAARLGIELRDAAEGESAGVELRLDAGVVGEEAYELTVTQNAIVVVASTERGLFYGAATLAQWMELHRENDGGRPVRLTGIRVRDRPAFAVRGVMLDISRDKVPRFETVLELVDLFAGLKLNQLQLYMEHTFAYRGHEVVWRDASPFTADEVRRLDAYCRERFIELVPNQQSFGHFHRWLVHAPYRALAECPDGIEHPFSLEIEPFSLCPVDPGTLELLADLYGQLLPSFESRLVNVGCDETFELGRGRSRQACEERGKERVYVDFLRQVHDLVGAHGRRMQFWGDMILERPELIAELPDDVIALEWGYEADHPFAEDCRRFAASGRDFYVCPGTSSWNSFAGRTRNAVLNLASAAVHGREHGAAGYLITDWGDNGHLQPWTASYAGFVAGAAFAWNVESARDPLGLPLEPLLDRHVYRDRAGLAGRVTTSLGDAYLHAGPAPRNGSALFFLVVFALLDKERERTAGVTSEALEQALGHVESSAFSLEALKLESAGAAWIARELAWSADMLSFACRFGIERWRSGDLGSFDGISAARRGELGRELRTLVERHREIHLARNRPGGWERASGWLRRVGDLLE